MAKEYTYLFNAVSRSIRAIQAMLLLQGYVLACARQESDLQTAFHTLMEQYEKNIAETQILQEFLVKAQQDAEEIYLERTD